MSDIVIPKNYKSQLNLYETQVAIKTVKDFFQGLLAERLHLLRVSAPLFVDPTSGLNDNLNKWKQENSPRQLRSHPHCGRQREASGLQREDFPIRLMSPEISGIISSHCLTSRSDRTETKF